MDVHISVIADIKSLGLDIDIVDWCFSGHAYVMKRSQDQINHINAATWMSMNPTSIRKFQDEYHSFLCSFDGFIVAHASCFAQVFEKYNKPIFLVNSCRIDLPYCFTNNMAGRAGHIACLQRLNKAGLLVPVSNNRADQLYTLRATGIQTRHIPSLCLYTKMKYEPTRKTFLCYTGSCPPNPRITQRSEIGHFEWKTVGEFKGVIHFPYEISTMSLFEQFSAGCPMFFPSKQYLRAHADSLSSIRAYWGDRPIPDEYGDLRTISTWIEYADFYDTFKSPNTQYFDSIDHLTTLLDSFVYVNDTAERAKYIESTRAQWKELFITAQLKPLLTKEPVHLCYNRLPVPANVVFDIQYRGLKTQHSYPYRDICKGDVVFVKTDILDWFVDNVKTNVPYTLVTGVADLSPSDRAATEILGNPVIKRWVGCNIKQRHPKIRKIPIGVGEPEQVNGKHELIKELHDSRRAWTDKANDICIPFHNQTHVGRTLTSTLEKLPYQDYMLAIGAHRFVVCMRGNGIDTHRFCEILLMGSVPILLHSELDDMYEQFPCIIVDSFDAIDTSNFVWDESKYQQFLAAFWLKPEYWKHIFTSD